MIPEADMSTEQALEILRKHVDRLGKEYREAYFDLSGRRETLQVIFAYAHGSYVNALVRLATPSTEVKQP